MKKNLTFLKKIPLSAGLIFLIFMPFKNQAQSVKRECISSYGAFAAAAGASFGQTAGQPYNTTASFATTTAILQGFEQPVIFRVVTIHSELSKDLNLNVYPNPAVYSVTIQSREPVENAIVSVNDLSGKLIYSEKLEALHLYEINCDAWKNGIYIITVSDKNKNKSSLRLTINK